MAFACVDFDGLCLCGQSDEVTEMGFNSGVEFDIVDTSVRESVCVCLD
jgi:hypothetical protein